LLYKRADANAKVHELWQRNEQTHDERLARIEETRTRDADRAAARDREDTEKERNNRVLDIQRAGSTYNQAYPKDPITGIRKGSDGKAAPDFQDWFANQWPTLSGQASKSAPPGPGGSLLDHAKSAIAQGAPRDKVREVFIKEGGKAEEFDAAFPSTSVPPSDDPPFVPGP
jgi:hypothetical protein